MNEAFKNEISTYQKESSHFKNQVGDKQFAVKQLELKLDQLAQCSQLEFPIVIGKMQGFANKEL